MLAKKLNYGDTIGIIAPASPEDDFIIKEKLELLINMGFHIKEGTHLYDRNGYLAGSDLHRAQDLNDMFSDDEVNMILCFRGGYGTMRILPLIDFDNIRRNPKIFIGFSDITTLLNNFYEKCGLITFHGPMAKSDFNDECTTESFLETLMRGTSPFNINNPTDMPLIFHNFNKSLAGTVVGGNLSLICSTLGTEYEVNFQDKFLFIEDVEEPPYKIDRMLTHLILSNKLKKCKGILLGQFTDCNLPHYQRSLTLDEVINDRLISLGIPICSNFMSGHGSPKLTLPIGANINLNPDKNYITVTEKVVK